MDGKLIGFDGKVLDPCVAYESLPGSPPCDPSVGVGVRGTRDIIPLKALMLAGNVSSLDTPSTYDNDTILQNQTRRSSGIVMLLNIHYTNYALKSGNYYGTGTLNDNNVMYFYTGERVVAMVAGTGNNVPSRRRPPAALPTCSCCWCCCCCCIMPLVVFLVVVQSTSSPTRSSRRRSPPLATTSSPLPSASSTTTTACASSSRRTGASVSGGHHHDDDDDDAPLRLRPPLGRHFLPPLLAITMMLPRVTVRTCLCHVWRCWCPCRLDRVPDGPREPDHRPGPAVRRRPADGLLHDELLPPAPHL